MISNVTNNKQNNPMKKTNIKKTKEALISSIKRNSTANRREVINNDLITTPTYNNTSKNKKNYKNRTKTTYKVNNYKVINNISQQASPENHKTKKQDLKEYFTNKNFVNINTMQDAFFSERTDLDKNDNFLTLKKNKNNSKEALILTTQGNQNRYYSALKNNINKAGFNNTTNQFYNNTNSNFNINKHLNYENNSNIEDSRFNNTLNSYYPVITNSIYDNNNLNTEDSKAYISNNNDHLSHHDNNHIRFNTKITPIPEIETLIISNNLLNTERSQSNTVLNTDINDYKINDNDEYNRVDNNIDIIESAQLTQRLPSPLTTKTNFFNNTKTSKFSNSNLSNIKTINTNQTNRTNRTGVTNNKTKNFRTNTAYKTTMLNNNANKNNFINTQNIEDMVIMNFKEHSNNNNNKNNQVNQAKKDNITSKLKNQVLDSNRKNINNINIMNNQSKRNKHNILNSYNNINNPTSSSILNTLNTNLTYRMNNRNNNFNDTSKNDNKNNFKTTMSNTHTSFYNTTYSSGFNYNSNANKKKKKLDSRYNVLNINNNENYNTDQMEFLNNLNSLNNSGININNSKAENSCIMNSEKITLQYNPIKNSVLINPVETIKLNIKAKTFLDYIKEINNNYPLETVTSNNNSNNNINSNQNTNNNININTNKNNIKGNKTKNKLEDMLISVDHRFINRNQNSNIKLLQKNIEEIDTNALSYNNIKSARNSLLKIKDTKGKNNTYLLSLNNHFINSNDSNSNRKNLDSGSNNSNKNSSFSFRKNSLSNYSNNKEKRNYENELNLEYNNSTSKNELFNIITNDDLNENSMSQFKINCNSNNLKISNFTNINKAKDSSIQVLNNNDKDNDNILVQYNTNTRNSNSKQHKVYFHSNTIINSKANKKENADSKNIMNPENNNNSNDNLKEESKFMINAPNTRLTYDLVTNDSDMLEKTEKEKEKNIYSDKKVFPELKQKDSLSAEELKQIVNMHYYYKKELIKNEIDSKNINKTKEERKEHIIESKKDNKGIIKIKQPPSNYYSNKKFYIKNKPSDYDFKINFYNEIAEKEKEKEIEEDTNEILKKARSSNNSFTLSIVNPELYKAKKEKEASLKNASNNKNKKKSSKTKNKTNKLSNNHIKETIDISNHLILNTINYAVNNKKKVNINKEIITLEDEESVNNKKRYNTIANNKEDNMGVNKEYKVSKTNKDKDDKEDDSSNISNRSHSSQSAYLYNKDEININVDKTNTNDNGISHVNNKPIDEGKNKNKFRLVKYKSNVIKTNFIDASNTNNNNIDNNKLSLGKSKTNIPLIQSNNTSANNTALSYFKLKNHSSSKTAKIVSNNNRQNTSADSNNIFKQSQNNDDNYVISNSIPQKKLNLFKNLRVRRNVDYSDLKERNYSIRNVSRMKRKSQLSVTKSLYFINNPSAVYQNQSNSNNIVNRNLPKLSTSFIVPKVFNNKEIKNRMQSTVNIRSLNLRNQNEYLFQLNEENTNYSLNNINNNLSVSVRNENENDYYYNKNNNISNVVVNKEKRKKNLKFMLDSKENNINATSNTRENRFKNKNITSSIASNFSNTSNNTNSNNNANSNNEDNFVSKSFVVKNNNNNIVIEVDVSNDERNKLKDKLLYNPNIIHISKSKALYNSTLKNNNCTYNSSRYRLGKSFVHKRPLNLVKTRIEKNEGENENNYINDEIFIKKEKYKATSLNKNIINENGSKSKYNNSKILINNINIDNDSIESKPLYNHFVNTTWESENNTDNMMYSKSIKNNSKDLENEKLDKTDKYKETLIGVIDIKEDNELNNDNENSYLHLNKESNFSLNQLKNNANNTNNLNLNLKETKETSSAITNKASLLDVHMFKHSNSKSKFNININDNRVNLVKNKKEEINIQVDSDYSENEGNNKTGITKLNINPNLNSKTALKAIQIKASTNITNYNLTDKYMNKPIEGIKPIKMENNYIYDNNKIIIYNSNNNKTKNLSKIKVKGEIKLSNKSIQGKLSHKLYKL